MRKILFLGLSVIILFSCEKSIQKETNREADIIFAKSLIQNFYKDCASNNLEELYKNLSSEVDTSVVKKVILIKDSLGFNMKNYKIENVETFYTEIKEKDSITKKLEIHAFIKAYNNKDTISENLNFIKINNETTKIVGYHIKG
jgi:hypothetical protein